MYVIMPKASSTARLRELQSVLTADKIEKMINSMTIKTAVILFPKMNLKSSHQLKTNFLDLGLKSLFDPSESDLSVMSDGLQSHGSPNRRTSSKKPKPTSANEAEGLFVFPRIGEDKTGSRTRRDVSYKVDVPGRSENPLKFKDFILRKRLVKKSPGKKQKRNKRQSMPFSAQKLDLLRQQGGLRNPYLFAEEIIHKVDLTINEKGTEGGAATAITLNRSGTNVVFRVDVPFMFLIRHDPTHVPLFYGVVFEPQT
jgi:Serpin (serine protease inhibitor)